MKKISSIVILLSILHAKNIPSCNKISFTVSMCNPYQINFLNLPRLVNKSSKSLHNRAITTKSIIGLTRKEIENNSVLSRLLERYFSKQDKLYSRRTRSREVAISNKYVIPEEKGNEKSKNTSSENPQTKDLSLKNMLPRKSLPTNVPSNTIDMNVTQTSDYAITGNIKKEKLRYATHRVQNGEYPSMIAKKFSVSIDELIKINHLEKKSVLRIGQKIFIPAKQEFVDAIDNFKYRVHSGDSLISIARIFNVSLSDLKKYNNIKNGSFIRIGQKLILPLPEKIAEFKAIEKKKEKIALAKKKKQLAIAKKKKELALKKKRIREALAKKALEKEKRKKFLKISGGMKHKLSVMATAYASFRGETDKTPFLAAWNNHIRPGMKIIAVSWDLIRRYGITNGVKVKISGLPGIYTVRDKMNKKWRKRIDIYMGTSRRRTNRWGKRRVMIYY